MVIQNSVPMVAFFSSPHLLNFNMLVISAQKTFKCYYDEILNIHFLHIRTQ